MRSILIWDANEKPNINADLVILWVDGEDEKNLNGKTLSISNVVEKNASNLKRRYLKWIHELSETKIKNRTVSDHLRIRSDLSFWWMTSVSQKSSITSKSGIQDAIKLLALESIISHENNPEIILHSSNTKLAECLSKYCEDKKWIFKYNTNNKKLIKLKWKNTFKYSNIPAIIRTIISFCRYCVSRIDLDFQKNNKNNIIGEISFFDVLVHLDKSNKKKECFASNYWGSLLDKLTSKNIKTNWFHLYYPHPETPTFKNAKQKVRAYETNIESGQIHRMIEGNLPVEKLMQGLANYFYLYRKRNLIDSLKKMVYPQGSELDLWPLHRDQWKESMIGPSALTECLRLGMFEVALDKLKKQKIGIYISENQPWEISLVYAWRKNNHGKIIAVPHTTVRYWDLRYFFDSNTYKIQNKTRLPLPDYVGVNGPVMYSLMVNGGYPENKIIKLEALRFMHLNNCYKDIQKNNIEKKILICGDYCKETNEKIFIFMKRIMQDLPKKYRFVFKAHPACPFKPDEETIVGLNLKIDEQNIENIIHECDIIIASEITSAGVDAYCIGKRVIQIASNSGININPLREIGDVPRVKSSEKLLEEILSETYKKNEKIQFFYLDIQLKEWEKLILTGEIQ